MKSKFNVFLLIIFLVLCVMFELDSETKAGSIAERPSAVIVAYHRFGEPQFPSTNIRIEQFKSHILELQKEKYNVLPITEIIQKISNKEKMPEYTIGISIDDAYRSVFEKAWPLLKAAKLPFTLFLSTDVIDRNARGYMNWDEIRELKSSGVTIGSQTKSHKHLPLISLEDAKLEIDKANARIISELSFKPELFAYP
ncbi:MAG: polysaccharide deacetylase family protein, partial [Alphaproteobacteria bacterium]|nr:polysaccharide deacetylase family protein [Alphaproteobacteria bacterium]